MAKPPNVELGATVAVLNRGRSLLKGLLVVIAFSVATFGTPSVAGAGSSLFFGFSDDGPKWNGSAAAPGSAVGASAFRVTLRWVPGESDLSAQSVAELATAVSGTSGLRLVLAVYGSATSAPQNDISRTQFCTYARNAIARFPSINDVVVWNEPNLSFFWRPQFNPDNSSAAPAAYEALLARCWGVLHAFRPGINVVGPATSPRGNDNPNAVSNISHSPVNFIKQMGAAFRASGRSERLFDTVGQHVYQNSFRERPFLIHTVGTGISEGDWNKLVQTLQEGFAGTAQPVPGHHCDVSCVPIWYLESGFQTAVPPEKAGYYTGTENTVPIADFTGGEAEFPTGSPSRRGGPRRLAVRSPLGGRDDEGIVRIARLRHRRRKQPRDLLRRTDGSERARGRAERRSSAGEVELERRRERDRRLRLRHRPRRGQHRPANRLDLHRRDRYARRDLRVCRPRIRRRRRERRALGCRDCLAARATTSATSATSTASTASSCAASAFSCGAATPSGVTAAPSAATAFSGGAAPCHPAPIHAAPRQVPLPRPAGFRLLACARRGTDPPLTLLTRQDPSAVLAPD